jgi:hypothetical protein
MDLHFIAEVSTNNSLEASLPVPSDVAESSRMQCPATPTSCAGAADLESPAQIAESFVRPLDRDLDSGIVELSRVERTWLSPLPQTITLVTLVSG